MTSPVDADAFVSELSDLFARLGGLHYGEDVTQLEHAVQTAHHAQADGAPPALVAAALLHARLSVPLAIPVTCSAARYQNHR